MSNSQILPTIYTPEQVATLLQLSKNTVYDLINRGEILAKKLGKVYRIPAHSLSFFLYGLDYDLLEKEKLETAKLVDVHLSLAEVRKNLKT